MRIAVVNFIEEALIHMAEECGHKGFVVLKDFNNYIDWHYWVY